MSEVMFKLEPFKDTIYVAFNLEELNRIKGFYKDGGTYGKVGDKFDSVGTNHEHLILSAVGAASTHVLYFPIVERQDLGTNWEYMLTVVNKMATTAVLECVKNAGYNPMNEPVMFVQLVARLTERVTRVISDRMGGRLTIASGAARDIDQTLNPTQLHYIDDLTPRTLSDLARQHCMLVDNGVVYYSGDSWRSTTYFY